MFTTKITNSLSHQLQQWSHQHFLQVPLWLWIMMLLQLKRKKAIMLSDQYLNHRPQFKMPCMLLVERLSYRVITLASKTKRILETTHQHKTMPMTLMVETLRTKASVNLNPLAKIVKQYLVETQSALVTTLTSKIKKTLVATQQLKVKYKNDLSFFEFVFLIYFKINSIIINNFY